MENHNPAIMTEESWQNLKAQLRVMIDIYCEMNEEVFKIKSLLKKIVKHLAKNYQPEEKKCKTTNSKKIRSKDKSKKSGRGAVT